MITRKIDENLFISNVMFICTHDIYIIGEISRVVCPIGIIRIVYIIEFFISKPKPSRIGELYIFVSGFFVNFYTIIASEKYMMMWMRSTGIIYEMISIIIWSHTCLSHRKGLSDTEYEQNNQ